MGLDKMIRHLWKWYDSCVCNDQATHGSTDVVQATVVAFALRYLTHALQGVRKVTEKNCNFIQL